MQLEDNEADKMFKEYKKIATGVVDKQQSTEATTTAAIAAADAKDNADSTAEMNRVTSKHRAAMKVYQPWMMVYIPEEEISLAMY